MALAHNRVELIHIKIFAGCEKLLFAVVVVSNFLNISRANAEKLETP